MKTIKIKLNSRQYAPEKYTGKVIWNDGVIGYFLNGEYHRLDGAAYIGPDSRGRSHKQYVINGHVISINNKQKFYNSKKYKQWKLLENMKKIKGI